MIREQLTWMKEGAKLETKSRSKALRSEFMPQALFDLWQDIEDSKVKILYTRFVHVFALLYDTEDALEIHEDFQRVHNGIHILEKEENLYTQNWHQARFAWFESGLKSVGFLLEDEVLSIHGLLEEKWNGIFPNKKKVEFFSEWLWFQGIDPYES